MISDIFCAEILIVGVFWKLSGPLMKMSLYLRYPSYTPSQATKMWQKIRPKNYLSNYAAEQRIDRDLSLQQLLALFIFVDYDYNQIG